MSVIERSIFINAPVEEVFKPASDPKAWEQWYAGLSGPDSMVGEGEAGSVLSFNYSMIGLKLPITVKVIERSTSPEKCVWSGTFEGGIDGKQTFTYTKKDGGTQVDAHIEYTIPGKVLGKIANNKIVEKLQEHATEHSLSNLKVLAEHSLQLV